MSKIKNQHKVPKCYLKNFVIDGQTEGIWLFDKKLKKEIQSNINDVATRRYFYDIPEGYIVEGQDKQVIEKKLSSLEGEYNSLLTKLINNLAVTHLLSVRQNQTKYLFTNKFKIEMSFFLALQLARTEEFRKMFTDVNVGMLEKLANDILANDIRLGKAPKELEGQRIEASLVNGHEVVEHIKMLGDETFLSNLQKVFYDKIWIFGKNKSDHALYTSDHPIAIHPYQTHPMFGVGIGSPYTEVVFPLSSSLILIMYDRNSFESSLGQLENSIINLGKDHITFYNSLQCKSSTRQVFCSTCEFQIAKDMIKNNPELTNIDRPRLIVE